MFLNLLALAGFAALPHTAAAQAAPPLRDTLRLYYVGHAIGYERYVLQDTAGGYRWSSDFDYVDRGRRTHVVGAGSLTGDYTPVTLDVRRLTDTSATTVARVDIANHVARVRVGATPATDVALPAAAFAIAGDLPTAQHLLLLRYWLAHGRPHRLAVVPGGPTNVVTVEHRGTTTLSLDGKRQTFERYSMDGVVWGVESVWVDAAGRLAVVTSGGGGGLTLEAVRNALTPLYARIMAVVIHDRMDDLARITARIHPDASGTVALVGATLIDGTGAAAVPDATVITANGTIVAAGPSAQVRVPAGAQRVDVRGKTIMPGLWNMHTHLHQIEWLPVYIAAGETSVRDMGNEVDFELALRHAVQSGASIGPTLYLAGLVDGGGPNAFGAVTADTPDQGRAVVRRYHDLGFGQIKMYDLLQPAVVGAITREAHRLNMTVTGHVPRALGLFATIDSGQDQIAHMNIRGRAGSDTVHAQVAFMKAHGTAMDPTLSWGDLLQRSKLEPVDRYIPGVHDLPPVLEQRIVNMGADIDTVAGNARRRNSLGILDELYEAGVPLLPGTDEGVPGKSLYRELELYVQAGMTNMDALRAATSVSAHALGMDAVAGTVRAGLRADLIVLDGNPLDDITNIRRVRMVMKSGVLYRTADVWRAVGFTPPD
ncbi:MAG TPA: amidohydrolase family protein [Gemmatimonadaceae bacterium]|nr:amidohydrolase family protein [Gemmatimonadaceae bacterium]